MKPKTSAAILADLDNAIAALRAARARVAKSIGTANEPAQLAEIAEADLLTCGAEYTYLRPVHKALLRERRRLEARLCVAPDFADPYRER